MRKLSSIFIVILVHCSGCASIPREAWGPVVDKPFQYAGYQIGEGMFVVIPFGIGAFTGSPTALLTGPIAFLCEPEKGEAEIAKGMGFFLLGPVVVGDIVGTPFLAIKKIILGFSDLAFQDEWTRTGISARCELWGQGLGSKRHGCWASLAQPNLRDYSTGDR